MRLYGAGAEQCRTRWAVFGAPVNNGALSLNASPVMVTRWKPEGGWEVHSRVFPGARIVADQR